MFKKVKKEKTFVGRAILNFASSLSLFVSLCIFPPLLSLSRHICKLWRLFAPLRFPKIASCLLPPLHHFACSS